MTWFVIRRMSLELIGIATILRMKISNLPSEPFYRHGIGVSDDGGQVYVQWKCQQRGAMFSLCL